MDETVFELVIGRGWRKVDVPRLSTSDGSLLEESKWCQLASSEESYHSKTNQYDQMNLAFR